MVLGLLVFEILLFVIEICGNNFDVGEFGLLMIVGFVVFNLLIIIVVCVYVIFDGECCWIKYLWVFVIIVFMLVFVYVWLYIILVVLFKDEVEIWEVFLILFFFLIMVIFVYIVDWRLLFYRVLRKGRRR